MHTERSTLSAVAQRSETVHPVGIPARIVLLVGIVVGVIVAAPSGFGLLWFIPYAGVGTLLVIRRPGTSIGWILLALAWAFAIVTLPVNATPGQFVDGSLGPVEAMTTVVSAGAGAAAFFLFALLAIVFPSGRLPRGRWGAIGRLWLGVALAFVAANAVTPTITVSLWGNDSSMVVRNPAALLPGLPIWSVVTPDTAILPIALLMVAAAVSLVIRYRQASGIERQQYRWLTAALAFVVAAVVGGYVVGLLLPAAGASGVVWLGAVVAFPLVPIAIGIAVLRYRLYEIDRIISRTVSYGLVTAILAVVFAGPILVSQTILASFTSGSSVAVAASTLVVAALFQPLRRRVQAAVDRRFNRSGYNAEQTVAAFAGRLREEVELDNLRIDLLATVTGTLDPSRTSLWLRQAETR